MREPGEDDVPESEGPATQEPRKDVWRTIPPEWLSEPPPARRWLLRRPTRDGDPCPPHTGDGVLPLGKVGLLVADGGVGKTHALVALAVSVITGRPWLNYFYVPVDARYGKVCLLLAEEDEEEAWRRCYTVAQAYQLTEADKAQVTAQLVILPLAGKTVAIMKDDAESSALVALRERLVSDPGAHGWSLVALDPFSRIAPNDSEIDNALATRTIQAAETLTEAPGTPTVLIAHHTSLSAAKTGEIRARGVTGIRDAARWEATLRTDGSDVWFKQSKSNYSVPMNEELRLIREPGGVLRVATEAEEEERRERQEHGKDARRESRIVELETEILSALTRAVAPPTSRVELRGLVPGRIAEKEEAISRLVGSGRILRPESKKEPYRLP